MVMGGFKSDQYMQFFNKNSFRLSKHHLNRLVKGYRPKIL